jgi:hypothetical protein
VKYLAVAADPSLVPNQLVDLSSSVAALVLALSLLVSVTFYLITGLSPCGMITPAYLVLSLFQSPWSLAVLAGGTALLWLVMLIANRFMMLFGKRLFAVTVIFGVIIQTSAYLVLHSRAPWLYPHDTLSYVAPGLIVYQLIRQKKPWQSLGLLGSVAAFAAALVFGILALPV